MNAHKAAIKTVKAHKADVKDERYWMKIAIKDTVHQGKECITRSIHYTENLDWLRKNGFKYTKHSHYEDLYIISWKDC